MAGAVKAAALLLACGGGAPTPAQTPLPDPVTPPPFDCAAPETLELRRDLLDRAFGVVGPPGVPDPELGEQRAGAGITTRALRWPHPDVPGDLAYGLLVLPEPVPDRPLPLLVNLHGHWGGGVEADEPARRARLFARQGWAVISVANRGTETGGDPVPAWRAVQEPGGLWGELRMRRGGRTPLGWDVRAAQAILGAASSGRLGVRVDMDRVAAMGFSGGSERAVLLGVSDPRIAAVVLGAHEYAFRSMHGEAGASDGVLRGAGEVPGAPAAARWPELPDEPEAPPEGGRPRAWDWLALSACRAGTPPRPRPVLVWDNRPDDAVDAALLAMPGVRAIDVPGVHGVTGDMAARSWAFLEEAPNGVRPGAEAVERARAANDAAWPPAEGFPRFPLAPGMPAPGQVEQGAPPWSSPGGVHEAAVRALLGFAGDGPRDPGQAFPWLPEPPAPTVTGEGSGPRWLVVAPPTPVPGEPLDRDGEVAYRPALPVGTVAAHLRRAGAGRWAEAALRVGRSGARDKRETRWSIERGVPALGSAVHDVRKARARVAELEGRPVQEIGLVGVGAGGVAVLWAALLDGGGRVVLVHAPVTLWLDGPGPELDRPAAEAPFLPWPGWTTAPLPSGVALDPYPAAAALGAQVTWVDPRDGAAEPWAGPLPPGNRRAEDLSEALK